MRIAGGWLYRRGSAGGRTQTRPPRDCCLSTCAESPSTARAMKRTWGKIRALWTAFLAGRVLRDASELGRRRRAQGPPSGVQVGTAFAFCRGVPEWRKHLKQESAGARPAWRDRRFLRTRTLLRPGFPFKVVHLRGDPVPIRERLRAPANGPATWGICGQPTGGPGRRHRLPLRCGASRELCPQRRRFPEEVRGTQMSLQWAAGRH